MSGTKIGAAKAISKILAKDPDHFRKIGAIGGSRTGIKKGFALNRERARTAGAKGGRISRRRPKIVI
jgi:general stress protein YciG